MYHDLVTLLDRPHAIMLLPGWFVSAAHWEELMTGDVQWRFTVPPPTDNTSTCCTVHLSFVFDFTSGCLSLFIVPRSLNPGSHEHRPASAFYPYPSWWSFLGAVFDNRVGGMACVSSSQGVMLISACHNGSSPLTLPVICNEMCLWTGNSVPAHVTYTADSPLLPPCGSVPSSRRPCCSHGSCTSEASQLLMSSQFYTSINYIYNTRSFNIINVNVNFPTAFFP